MTEATPAPVPKHAIGDTIWVPVLNQSTKTLECPDCNGTRTWRLIAPSGVEHEVDCPRCSAPGWASRDLPSLSYRAWEASAAPRKITGVEITTLPFRGESCVRYQCYQSAGGGHVVSEGDEHPDEASALAAAEMMAALKNAEIEATAEVLEKRRFATVKWDEARFDQFKNNMWEAFYQMRNLASQIRDMLDSGDSPSASDMRESLEDFLKFSVGHYATPTPLERLVRAAEKMVAEGSAPDALVAALDGMPAPMRGALKADSYAEWAAHADRGA